MPSALSTALAPPTHTWHPPTCPPPEVSVIIRTYNDPADWLRGAVDSALAQTGVTVEVILVDDGSSQTPHRFTDPRVGLLRLYYNAGLASARNEGESRARGEFVRMLDSDDALPPGALAAQVAALRDNPKAQVVAGRLELYDDPQAEWVQDKWLREAWDGDPKTLARALLADPRTLVPGPGLLWRRGWAPPVPIDFVTGDDAAFYRQSLAAEPEPEAIVWLDQSVLRYRNRDDSLSGGEDNPAHRFWRRETARRCELSMDLARYTTVAAEPPERPLKLAILDEEWISGGAQWSLAQMACHLDRRLIEPVFLSGSDSALTRWLGDQGHDVRVMPAGSRFEAWVEQQLASERFDLLDVTWAAYLVTPRMRELVPAVCAHAQSTDLSYAQLRQEDGRARRFDRVIAVSDDVLRAHPHLGQRGVVIPSPVDADRLRRAAWMRPLVRQALGLGLDETVVLWSGRLNGDRKRADALKELIDGCAGLGVRFLVAGHLPDVADYQPIRDEWADWFRAHGAVWVDGLWPMDMPGMYAAADVYLSTSELEGLSLSMLEAMAAGCVPVVTDVGGVRQAVDDGLTGWIVPLRQGRADVGALRAALARVVSLNSEEGEAIRRRARHAAVARFDVRNCARQHTLVYLEAASQRPSRVVGHSGEDLAAALTEQRLGTGEALVRTGDGRMVGRVTREFAEGLVPSDAAWLPPTCAVPEVSVIIRAYDSNPDWLTQAVDSVLGQTGVTVEVILVDDGSAKPAKWRPDARCGYLRLPYNQGLAAARNAGVARARGEFVRLLDSDDELPDGALAAQVATLKAAPRARMVAGRLVTFEAPEVEWGQQVALRELWNGQPGTLTQLVVDHPKALVPAPSVMWRRAWAPPEVTIDFETADDTAFYRQALAAELAHGNRRALVWVEHDVLRYRQHEGSNSGGEASPHAAFMRRETERRVAYGRRLARHEVLARQASRPLRIMYLDWMLGAGGAQWAVAQVARHLDRRLAQPIWLVAYESRMADWLRAGGVEVRVRPDNAPSYHQWIEQQVDQLKPDVIDTAWVSDLVTPKVVKQVPLLCAHAQSTLLTYAMLGASQGLWEHYHRFLAVSRDVLTANPHLTPRSVVIPPPVDCARTRQAMRRRRLVRGALGLGADEQVVVWSGRRAGTEKRTDVLREIVEAEPGVRFLIAGAIQENLAHREAMAEDWRAWAAGHNVVWLDGVHPMEMPALMAAGDFYLSTSELEGMSLALLEAMAAGLYPVVTEVGGVRESVDDGLTGSIVPLVAGHVDGPALLSALRGAMEQSAEHLSLAARRIRRAATRFDVRESARRHALVYHQLDPYEGEDPANGSLS